MGSGCERKQRGCGPAKSANHRKCEKVAGPSEIASYICVAAKKADADGSERPGKEQREQEEGDPREFASQRGTRLGVSARGQVRVW